MLLMKNICRSSYRRKSKKPAKFYVIQKCNQPHIPFEWDDILNKGVREWKGKSLGAVICKLAWSSAIYNMWRQRNVVKFGNQLISEEIMLQEILLGG